MILSPADPAARRTRRAAIAFACPALLFLLLSLAVWAHHGLPLGPDQGSHDWAVGHRPSEAGAVARLLTGSGTGPVPYVVAALAGWTACPRSATPRREALAALAALATLLAGQAVRLAVMTALARPRPPVADWATGTSGSSFPSGHTTTTALAAGLLAWSVLRSGAPRPVVRIGLALCACWALAVGLTRIYLGVHWPTDVLGGWLFAAAWLALTLPALAGFVGPSGRTGGTGSGTG